MTIPLTDHQENEMDLVMDVIHRSGSIWLQMYGSITLSCPFNLLSLLVDYIFPPTHNFPTASSPLLCLVQNSIRSAGEVIPPLLWPISPLHHFYSQVRAYVHGLNDSTRFNSAQHELTIILLYIVLWQRLTQSTLP